MSDIYLIYYNGKFLGLIRDSESFWYLYEWLSDSDGVCNVISVDDKMLDMPDSIQNFEKLVSQHGEVSINRSKICFRMLYDDDLI